MEFFLRRRKSGLVSAEHGYFIEKFTVIKYKDREKHLENKPYDILEAICERGINCLLDAGITQMWNLIIEAEADGFGNADAEIGIGSTATAAVHTQSNLLDGSAEWKAMDGGYPTVVGPIATWSGTFEDGAAEYHWQECAVRNGAVSPIVMNRVVSDKGTKSAGEEWVARLAITLS